ncbi:MAG: hypothetical protein NTU70_00735 [Methylococcales bacterium]|nr:hypothetical protein [Methylococcales bacterium]
MTNFKKTATVALLAGLGFTGSSQAGLLYNITDLGTLDGWYSGGHSINASGQVTGFSATNLWDHAFVTNSSGKMIDLGALGAKMSSY